MVRAVLLSGATSDIDLLRPIALESFQHPDLETELLVYGTHFNPNNKTSKDKFKSFGTLVHELDTFSDGKTASLFGQTVALLDSFFTQHAFDVAVILGDRIEAFAAAVACHYRRVPIAHIHGGESTPHSLDDLARHSISTLAAMHFVASKEAAELLKKRGEDSDRIHEVGAMANDVISLMTPKTRMDVAVQIGLRSDLPWYVLTFHPDGLTLENSLSRARALALQIEDLNIGEIIVTASNADEGGDEMNLVWESLSAKRRFVHFRPNLGSELFSSLLTEAAGFFGNSSAIIHEAPLYGLPSVLIGPRQDGRSIAGKFERLEIGTELATQLRDFFAKATKGTVSFSLADSPSKKICLALSGIDWKINRLVKYGK